ncbi:hypothetical protein, partial [Elioraea rosea]|uniref:hypothetical protein n=1 Tax=Elioraea rosea TaxID=2492390 RepID=UPI00118356F9
MTIEGCLGEISRRSVAGLTRRGVMGAAFASLLLPGRALAQGGSGFAVRGVPAEATADTATAARERAIAG